MRTRFFALLITLNAVIVTAQMPPETIDAKAKSILDDVSKKTKTYKTIKAEFNIVMKGNDKKETENTKGLMQLKGNKYKLDLKGQNILCDGKTQWTYIKESNEVQVNNAPDPTKTDNINPINIFTIYEKGFKYKFDKEETKSGSTVQIINLYPLESGKKPYHTIKLFIDKLKKQITAVKVLNKDGTEVEIKVNKFEINTDIPDPAFAFNKTDYKDVEIVDLR